MDVLIGYACKTAIGNMVHAFMHEVIYEKGREVTLYECVCEIIQMFCMYEEALLPFMLSMFLAIYPGFS